MAEIEVSETFKRVLDFVNYTNRPIFLTGKAGTGKTTLLKYIRNNTWKQVAVCAPTGVAAINAGGSTLHSFLQLPFGPFLPSLKESGEIDRAVTKMPVLKMSAQRLGILRNLDLLVIDEISMVRADLLDLVDAVLRQARRNWRQPFGGIQVMMIGDMYQLPPVVQGDEWQLLKKIYPSPYFFDSLVVRSQPPVYIELDRIYRQNDPVFIGLLNQIRENAADQDCLELLNSRYNPELTDDEKRLSVTLTTHNRKADEINSKSLSALDSPTFTYRARIEHHFPEKNYPADEVLELKKGARVMFLRNNPEKNYYNGKCGVVTSLTKDKIFVRCDEDKQEIEVPRETWENITYSLDGETKQLREEVAGSFTQYPLRLAWAITIHKSQGLTFDRLIVDAAASFSSGQVYVALSRCRSLEGLVLSSRITAASLYSDEQVEGFSSRRNSSDEIERIYESAKSEYGNGILSELFDFSAAISLFEELKTVLFDNRDFVSGNHAAWTAEVQRKTGELTAVGSKFTMQLSKLLSDDHEQLPERLKKAADWFTDALSKLLYSLREFPVRTPNFDAGTAISESLQALHDALYLKRELLKSLETGFDLQKFVKARLTIRYPADRIEVFSRGVKSSTKKSSNPHPALYRKLLLVRDEIANDEHKRASEIAGNKALEAMCHLLPQTLPKMYLVKGMSALRADAYGEHFLKVIREYVKQHDTGNAASDDEDSDAGLYRRKQPVKGETRRTTLAMFRQGMKAAEIASTRGMAESTISGHLSSLVASGDIAISELIDAQRLAVIETAMTGFDVAGGALGAIKERLPESFTWNEIRYVASHLKYAATLAAEENKS